MRVSAIYLQRLNLYSHVPVMVMLTETDVQLKLMPDCLSHTVHTVYKIYCTLTFPILLFQ